MDQLTAYRILRLEPGCSLEEVKVAYAALSKEFHPEEQPEEFQRIHEAYRLLIKGSRRQRSSDGNNYDQDFHEVLRRTEERLWKEQSQQELKVDEILRQAERSSAEEESPEKYDFESVLRQDEQNERERLRQLCQKALIEMELILSPQYRNNIKIYREFFDKNEYQEILRNPEFLAGFCRMLEGSNLKKEIYSYIIDAYRLRGADPDSLKPEIADLYRVLERKGGMKKKKNGWAFVIPVAFLAAIRSGMKAGVRAARITHNSGAFIVVCILVVILCFFIWLYRKLTEKHSSIFAQFIIALCLTLSQFIMLGAEAYAPLIGVTGSDTVGFLLFALGCIWLIVLFIVAVARKIRKL